jgi:hypothetical protein
MNFFRVFTALGFLMIPGLSLGAHMISFLMVETGISESSPAAEASSLWENGLMDIFFDAGHIVSNAPVKRISAEGGKKLPDEVQREFNEAAAGGAEFFVLALLDYQGSFELPELKPQRVVLRLFRIKPYQLLGEQQYSGRTTGPVKEELAAAKSTARKIIPYIK